MEEFYSAKQRGKHLGLEADWNLTQSWIKASIEVQSCANFTTFRSKMMEISTEKLSLVVTLINV